MSLNASTKDFEGQESNRKIDRQKSSFRKVALTSYFVSYIMYNILYKVVNKGRIN